MLIYHLIILRQDHPECPGLLERLTRKDPESGYLRTELFILQISLRAPLRHQSWFLGSGCSRHMTGEKLMFQSLELKPDGIDFGGNQKEDVSEDQAPEKLSRTKFWFLQQRKK